MSHTHVTQQTIKIQKYAVLGACFVLLLLFAFYTYFVSASVLHVVMRQEVERQTAVLSSEVAQLEAEYIHAQHAVSEDIASRHGYVETEEKIFIDRDAATAVALSHTEE